MKLNKFQPNRAIQRLLKKTLFNRQLDYEIFSVENITLFSKDETPNRLGYMKYADYCAKLWDWLSKIDSDNSNEFYIEEHWLTVTKNKTPRWYFYNFYITFAWKAVNIFTIEEFFGKNITNDCWRFIFRGAFYYFSSEIPKHIIDTYFEIKSEWENTRNKDWQVIKRTRVDVAFDFDFPTFDYSQFVKKSVNSKTAIKAYNPNDEWLYTWIQYLPTKSNKWYWLRIYDKHQDTKDKNKQFWYWDSVKDYKNWNRIEYEIYPPYSNQCSDEELFSWFSHILFWNENVNDRKIVWQPKSQYDSRNSLKTFIKYSKNHWVNVWTALTDLNREFYASNEIDIILKLEVFADSLKEAVDQQNQNILMNPFQKYISPENFVRIENFFETDPRWKILLDFYAWFSRNREQQKPKE